MLTESDTSVNAWSVASGAYSSRFSGVGAGAVAAAADTIAAKVAAIRAHAGAATRSVASRACATGARSRYRKGWSQGSQQSPSTPLRTWSRPTRTTGSRHRRRTASSATSPSSRSSGETGRVRVLDYVSVHDAGRLLNPLIVDGQIRGGFAHGVGGGALRADRLRRGRRPPDGHVHRLPVPHRAGPPSAPDRPPRVAVAVHPLRREGSRRGQHDVGAGRDHERGRRRARGRSARAAADRGRASGSCCSVEAGAVRYERPETVAEAAALLAEHGDEAKVLAGGQSLVPLLNFRLIRPAVLVDVNRVAELRSGADGARRRDGAPGRDFARATRSLAQGAAARRPLRDAESRHRRRLDRPCRRKCRAAALPGRARRLDQDVEGARARGGGVLRLALHLAARAGRAARRDLVAGAGARSASRRSRCGTATSRSRWPPVRSASRTA